MKSGSKKIRIRQKFFLYFVLAIGVISIIAWPRYLSRAYNNFQLDMLRNSCENKANFERIRCLKPYFDKYTKLYSAEEALIQAKYLQETKFIDDCHSPAHFIGEATLEKHTGDVKAAYYSCSMGCIEGCYHGVIESHIAHQDNVEDAANNIVAWCNTIDEFLLKRQCFHGVGHGIIHDKKTTLVEAIEICKSFTDDFVEHTCLGGVLMQNVGNHLFLSKEELIKQIPSICAPVSDDNELTSMCIEMIGEGFMFYTGHDMNESKQLCEYVSLEERQYCLKGVEDEVRTNKTHH